MASIKNFLEEDSSTNVPLSFIGECYHYWNIRIQMFQYEYEIPIDLKKYRGTIVSLIYLTASRPDIMFSICLCALYQSCPKKYHLSSIKRIIKYLK